MITGDSPTIKLKIAKICNDSHRFEMNRSIRKPFTLYNGVLIFQLQHNKNLSFLTITGAN